MQDPLSFRTVPQVHGALREFLGRAEELGLEWLAEIGASGRVARAAAVSYAHTHGLASPR